MFLPARIGIVFVLSKAESGILCLQSVSMPENEVNYETFRYNDIVLQATRLHSDRVMERRRESDIVLLPHVFSTRTDVHDTECFCRFDDVGVKT